MRQILNNVAWGLAWGLAFATLLSLYAALLSVFRGSTNFDSYDRNLTHIVGLYFFAAVVAGAVAGLMRPLSRTRSGGTAMGALVGPLVYGAVSFGMGDSGGDLLWVALLAGVPVGAICGYYFSKPDQMPNQL